jgi:hypothetical protein
MCRPERNADFEARRRQTQARVGRQRSRECRGSQPARAERQDRGLPRTAGPRKPPQTAGTYATRSPAKTLGPR